MLRIVPLITLLSSAAYANPVPVQPGQRYPGGTEVAFAEAGIVLSIPKAWFGMMAPNGEAFLIGSDTEAGLVLATAEAAHSIDAVLADLNQPIPFEGIVLQPDGRPKRTKRGATHRYTASANGQHYVALARVVVHRGVAVGFVSLGLAAREKPFHRMLIDLTKRLRFVTPKKPKAPKGGAWAKRLRGYALEYLYTSSGYTSKHTIRLCNNGMYREGGDTGYVSGGFSAAGQHGGAGRYTIEGDVLRLNTNDGGTKTYRLTTDGSKTFLNGDRYFVVNPAGC